MEGTLWAAYLGVVVVGLLIGAGNALVLVSMGSGAARLLTYGTTAAVVSTFIGVHDKLGLPSVDPVYLYFSAFAVALLAGLLGTLKAFASLARRMHPDLSLLELMLLGADRIKQVAKAKDSLADAERRLSELRTAEGRAVADRGRFEVAAQRREEAIAKREHALNEREDRFNQQVTHQVHMALPLQGKAPFDLQSLANLPQFFRQYGKFTALLREATQAFSLEHKKTRGSPKEVLDGYLLYVCLLTQATLFNVTSGVRVHFRVLNGDFYEAVVCTIDGKRSMKPLTRIPSNDGLIAHSAKTGRSLLKSMNPNLVTKGANDHIWQDFLTIAITSFKDSRQLPLLSMGVSVENASIHADLLQLLNHCAVEKVIEDELVELDAQVGFANTISQVAV